MKLLTLIIVTVAALFAGIYLGPWLSTEDSYILLSVGDWIIETRLSVLVISIVVLVLVTYVVISLVSHTFSKTQDLAGWRARQKKKKSVALTQSGIVSFIEGAFDQAEKQLMKSALYSDTPLVNYLMAAEAAHALNAPKRRDEHLQQAYLTGKDNELAIALTQTKYWIEQGDLERARQSVNYLRKTAPKNPLVYQYTAKVLEAQKDWSALLDTFNSKTRAWLPHGDHMQMEELAWSAQIEECEDPKTLSNLFGSVPKDIKRKPEIIEAYVEKLMAFDRQLEAEQVLLKQFKYQLSDNLLRLFIKTTASKSVDKLARLEGLRKKYSDNAMLYYVIGLLSIQSQMYAKAKESLEYSLQIGPMPRTYQALAKLCELQNNIEGALSLYKKANQEEEIG